MTHSAALKKAATICAAIDEIRKCGVLHCLGFLEDLLH